MKAASPAGTPPALQPAPPVAPVAAPAPAAKPADAERPPARIAPLRDRRLHLAIALGYGLICAAGTGSPIVGVALIALFAASASLRSLFRSRWLVLALTVITVAAQWVPWLALAVAAATVVLILLRLAFVLENLRVVVAGLLVYAVALAWIVGGGRVTQALLVGAPIPAWLGGAGAWVAAPLSGCAAALLMSGVLLLSYRGGYTTARALEIISVIPLLLLSSLLPFVDHAAARTAWDSGALPAARGVVRVPPGMTEILDLVRAALGSVSS